MIIRRSRAVLVLLAFAVLAACHQEKVAVEQPFLFVVYPGAQYLPQLTELTKKAHKAIDPNGEIPPTAIYDSAASVDEVANFYVKSYNYGAIAPAADPKAKLRAYYRAGDLAADVNAIQPLLQKMNVKCDAATAVGGYKAVEIAAYPSRPRVTIQRPYFDVTSSKLIDRTLILMSR